MKIRGFKGEIRTDIAIRTIYSTDVSEYRQMPLAVVYPRDNEDIRTLIEFARSSGIALIPRGGGTSLAGQVVGEGIVVDVSRYMTRLLEVNDEERWARVQPGIVWAELNKLLQPYGLLFGPETSSGTRCTLGGMVGNNASGLHSLIYGSTRDKLLEVSGYLSDGSYVTFGPLSRGEFDKRLQFRTLEGQVYRQIYNLLKDDKRRDLIRQNYPDPDVKRRNTGYALDLLLDTEPFGGRERFNFARLLAGSEGTLMFFTEFKLELSPLPPKHRAVVAVHLEVLEQAFYANLIALDFSPAAVELMDSTVLELTKDNPEQRKNRFFVQGDPGAILIVEFMAGTQEEILSRARDMEAAMRREGLGYYFPLLWNEDIQRVWKLRNAGLGVLPNLYGKARPVSVIEDTAVAPKYLPGYIREVQQVLDRYNTSCVYYAHIGSGELHLRPVLDLRDKEGLGKFRAIAYDVAALVKKYRGSLSGEHGDGRLRGELIPFFYGQEIYQMFRQIKYTWDPQGIFNPGKIVDTPPMDQDLRIPVDWQMPRVQTYFRYDREGGFEKLALKCNGSANCRQKQVIGGTMCPSYKATEDEYYSTRARANMLREILVGSKKPEDFTRRELYEILDNCLMCKACKAECPANVDMTKLKQEFLQHYYDRHGVPLRSWLIANLPLFNKMMLPFAGLANKLINSRLAKSVFSLIGFTPHRDLPDLARETVMSWYKKHSHSQGQRRIYLFIDEFTNQYDSDIGIKAILFFERLGYEVIIPRIGISGRTYLSKGILKQARKIINKNIQALRGKISEHTPLVGLEPSAILTFRDEAVDLVDRSLLEEAKKIAQWTYTFEEFVAREADAGRITREMFVKDRRKVVFHGHCYQKALSSTKYTHRVLSLPENFEVEEIQSGCCGMAGAFGYEKEHYELSMKIGNLVLFPTIRQTGQEAVVIAPGTSCRHHIAHGTGRKAFHPVEILFEALAR